MQYPQFGGSINLGQTVITRADNVGDGSGTVGVILTGASKFASGTFDSTTELVTVSKWSQISSASIGVVKSGDIVSMASTAGAPGGVTVTTDYLICDLSVNTSTDVATFSLLSTTAFTRIDITSAGTTPHILRFPCGTRVDTVEFINTQTTPAASTINLGKLLMKPRNSSTWFLLREIALPAATRSTSVAGNRQTMTFTNGLFVPEGAQLGAQIAAYAGAQDATTVYAFQSYNL